MKFYQRIRTKIIFSFLLVALIPVVMTGFYVMQISKNMLYQRELNVQTHLIKNIKHDIEAFLALIPKDLIFLSQSQPLKHYLTLRHSHQNLPTLKLAQRTVEQEFLAFLRNRQIYYQIRYLDETGQEIVRVVTKNGQTQVITPAHLQNKAHRYYFTETMQLLDKEIFVSPLELNQEQGQIEVPHKPVIRYATPVYKDGQQSGIVILNVDANQFLQLLGDTWLLDHNGYYLAHPDINKCWGGPHDLNHGHNLTQDYPQLAPKLLADSVGHFRTPQIMLTFQRVFIPKLEHWILITQRPSEEILYSVTIFRTAFGMILLIAILTALFFAFFINQRMTAPITRFTQMVKQVRAGNRQVRVQVKRADELGMLEKEFNAMLEAICASEEALQKNQQEAQTANIAKSRFIANMSHELRTPLNAIIGYGEMLQEEMAELGEIELSSDIEKIHLAGKNLLSTINDILDISKIEAGKMELYIDTFYLPNMINDVIHTIQPLLTKNQDTLEVHYGTGLGEMHADLTKLRQILLKLLGNASKFNESANTISLEILKEMDKEGMDWIIFRVSDNGMGMDTQQKNRLFQIFNQTDISNTSSSANLGLTITHHFVQMMGGEIKVDSEWGKGSTFTVRLPAKVVSDQDQPVRDSHIEKVMLDEVGIILAIDDDIAVRDVLYKYLSKQGYQVETAENGEEGLRLARKILPDIILLDVMMPKMDGWEVLSHLKAEPDLAHIPVIMLSMIEDKHVGYSLGASDYLIKPINREQLLKAVKKYHFSYNPLGCPVMVIDDDPVNRDMVGRMLRKAGLRVCQVEDGRIALNSIHKKRPALVLLDLQMPEMDGFEFIIKLQQIHDSIPVIVFTAKDITVEDRLRLDDNATYILQKGSYSHEELLAKINDLLAL